MRENAFGAHSLQLYHKNEYGDPHFFFMILIRTVLPFDEKKIGTNLCSVFFGNFTKLYGLSYHGWNSACQEPITWSLHFPYKPFESTLSDEKLFIEIAFAEYFSRLLSNIQSEQSYDHTSHAASQKRDMNCCQQWR